ncbi:MAG: hypothetical protein Q9220_001728 [cf. Caloplaca sp. 1 TL-2023]
MLAGAWLLLLALWRCLPQAHAAPILNGPCPEYWLFAKYRNGHDFSAGKFHLPYQRPVERCRKFHSPTLEATITRLRDKIEDPDLFRLFENTYPNTLDTAVLWRGFAWDTSTNSSFTDEELAFVITGDINAMWLRDSANQILSYLPILEASQDNNTIAALFRGVINLQSRYIKISPYCHAFQPPPESHLRLGINLAYHRNKVKPPYDRTYTFDCKWELDSLASFLQISSEYYNATRDMRPFIKYRWVETIGVILNAVEAMRTPTYTPDGECFKESILKHGERLTPHRAHCSKRLYNDRTHESSDGNHFERWFRESCQVHGHDPFNL